MSEKSDAFMDEKACNRVSVTRIIKECVFDGLYIGRCI